MEIERSCRICTGQKFLINIFDRENTELIDIIRVSAEIEVREDDPFPKQICLECKQGLEVAYKLRQLGKANAKKFQSQSEALAKKVKEEEVVEDSLSYVADEIDENGEYVCDEKGAVGNENIDHDNYGECEEDPPMDPLKYEDEPMEEIIYNYTLDEVDATEPNIEDDHIAECTEDNTLDEIMEEIAGEDLDCKEEELEELKEVGDIKEEEENSDDQDSTTTSQSSKSKPTKKSEPNKRATKRTKKATSTRPRKKAKTKDDTDEDENCLEHKQDPEDEYDDDAIYNGEMQEEPLLEFHKKVCRKPTSWQALLERLNLKDGEPRFKCKTCGVKYIKIASFVVHALKHTGEMTYGCRVPGCTNLYSNWRALQTHLVFHCDYRKYVCELCGIACKHRNGYYKHKKVHELRELREAEGPDLEGGVLRVLPRRRRRAAKKIPVIPEISDEPEDIPEEDNVVFDKENPSMEELLEFHQDQSKKAPKSWPELTEVITEGPNKYRCAACGKEYLSRKNHIYHVLKHTGERPMKCKVLNCNSSFRDWKKLKDHLVGHCEDRKFVCDTCGKGFKFRFALTKHAEMHSGEKKYKCSLCDATFYRKIDCSSHETRHKPGETLAECELCDKKFLAGTNLASLRAHMVDEHGVKMVYEAEKPPEPRKPREARKTRGSRKPKKTRGIKKPFKKVIMKLPIEEVVEPSNVEILELPYVEIMDPPKEEIRKPKEEIEDVEELVLEYFEDPDDVYYEVVVD